MRTHFDVIIIGAGPAGSRSALSLAGRGLRVLLLDKEVFPRHKVCGGLLSSKSLELLKDCRGGLPFSQTIHQIKLYSRQFEPITVLYPGILGKTLQRRDLDAYLANEAVDKGTTFKDGTAMMMIEQNKDRVTIHTGASKFTASYCIAADGAASPTALQLRMLPLFHQYKMGIAWSQMIPIHPGSMDPGAVELYFIPFLGGMGWCFPLGNAVNIGVGASCFAARRLYLYYTSFLKAVCSQKGMEVPREQPRGAMLPAGGFGRCIGKGRVLLAGDAAGGVDPFSGEGIDHALLSGQLAANAVGSALLDTRIQAEFYYAQQYDKAFSYEKRTALLLSLLSWHKGPGFFNLLKANPPLAEGFATIMSQPAAYRLLSAQNLLQWPKLFSNALHMKDIE